MISTGEGKKTTNLMVSKTIELSGLNDPHVRGRNSQSAKRIRANGKMDKTTRYHSLSMFSI